MPVLNDYEAARPVAGIGVLLDHQGTAGRPVRRRRCGIPRWHGGTPAHDLRCGSMLPRRSRLHADAHNLAFGRDVEQLVSLPRPQRRSAASRGHLPSSSIELREGLHVNFVAARFARLIHQPLAAGGHLGVPLVERSLEERSDVLSRRRRRPARTIGMQRQGSQVAQVSQDECRAVGRHVVGR